MDLEWSDLQMLGIFTYKADKISLETPERVATIRIMEFFVCYSDHGHGLITVQLIVNYLNDSAIQVSIIKIVAVLCLLLFSSCSI